MARSSVQCQAKRGPVVVIDNYDSFTYNLCQVILALFMPSAWMSMSIKNSCLHVCAMLCEEVTKRHTMLSQLHVTQCTPCTPAPADHCVPLSISEHTLPAHSQHTRISPPTPHTPFAPSPHSLAPPPHPTVPPQYLGDLGCDYVVYKNDEKSVADIRAMNPRGVLVSPGPGGGLKGGGGGRVMRVGAREHMGVMLG